MRSFFPIFLSLFSFVTLSLPKGFSQDQHSNNDVLGAKPGIIINTYYDCKVGHLNLSCVPVHCDSVSIFPGDTIQFCTDPVVDLISDTAYYIQWNFTGSTNYPTTVIDHFPISYGICRVPMWTIPGSYDVEIFYNGWLSAYPTSECYVQGPCHWIIRVNVGGTNGIRNDVKDEKVSVYPNPANDKLNVDLEDNGVLEIYSVLGEKVQNNLLKNGSNTIFIDTLDSGIYFLKISTESGVISKRIVKE